MRLVLILILALMAFVQSLTDDELQTILNYDPLTSSPSSLVDNTYYMHERLLFHRLHVCAKTYSLNKASSSVTVQLFHRSFYNQSQCDPFGTLTLTTDNYAFDLNVFEKLAIRNSLIQSEQSVATHSLAGSLLHVPFSLEIRSPANANPLRQNVTATLDIYVDSVHLEDLEMRDLHVYVNSLEYPVPRLMPGSILGLILYRDELRENYPSVLQINPTTTYLTRRVSRHNVDVSTGTEAKINCQVRLKLPAEGRYDLGIVHSSPQSIVFNTAQDTTPQLTFGAASSSAIMGIGGLLLSLFGIILAAWSLYRDYSSPETTERLLQQILYNINQINDKKNT